MTAEQEQKILLEARANLKLAMDEDKENRQAALEDLEFIAVEGKQWPGEIRAEREANGQPCLSINKMPVYVDQVVGDQRMNRPAIKVVPVDDKADPEVARILGGWIKHVQQISKSDIAIDHGFEHAATCGYGALRVVTKYVSDTTFDQEAYIEKIDNALAVFWGKHSEYDCSDAQYCFIITDITREEYKSKYGEDPVPFNTADSQFVADWSTKDTVRVAEYFKKEKVNKTLYLLNDGRTVFKLEPNDVLLKKRNVDAFTIMWYLLSGNKVLDNKEWVGKKYIPVVPIWGKEFNVGGKRVVRGLIRNAKDSQRMYNYWESCDTEVAALQPKTPYIATAAQIKGYESQWKEAHRKSFPYLLVNHDPKAPGFPQRQAPPQASSAMTDKIQDADQNIRDTIGLQRASLGMHSNERSGAAIRERKMEGDVGTFAFIDNLSRSIEHVGRILIDIAPGILDTERIVRLGLVDGGYEFAKINVEDPNNPGKIINDLTAGVYDIVVTVGPSFTTQRTEARISMQEFIQYYPQAAPLIGDLYAKNMDWPGADEVSERLAFLLPPEVKEKKALEEATKANGGQPPPPQPPPPPSPEQMAAVEEAKLKLDELKLKVAQEEEKLKALQIKNEFAIADGKDNIKNLIDEVVKDSTKTV